jgi:UDP-glucose 6-dehydrogenase
MSAWCRAPVLPSLVAVVEADPVRLKALHSGRMPIYEPGLDQLVAENVDAGRLQFTDDFVKALEGGRVLLPWGAQARTAVAEVPTSGIGRCPHAGWAA